MPAGAVDGLHDEAACQVTVSTAHKAKGLEYPRVQIAADFHPPKDTDQLGPDARPIPGPVDSAEARRLAYVAVTRAQQLLDRRRSVVSVMRLPRSLTGC
ncbi:3'-5' exonuclease [Streptomyces sp. NBC_01476]|uniref:3'-5' exonuclease n=1 Tax=Streptomyces sp. NBC_01476 TaxID=2903881 RepID=UPI003FCEC3DA